MTTKMVAPALALMLLTACNAPDATAPAAAPATAAPTAAAATPAPPTAPASAASAATPTIPHQDETGMHIECQGTRLTVAGLPAAGNDASPQTRLELEKDGQTRSLDKPAEMADLHKIITGTPVQNDVQGWCCQDYVMEALEGLNEEQIVDDEDYEKAKERLMRRFNN